MAKSECTNILPSIPLLADGALSAAESDRLKKHLSVCPACRREFDLYRAMKQTTASLPSPQLSSDFHEKLMKTIQEEAITQSKRTSTLRPYLRRKTMGYVATVAAAAAVVAISVVTLSQVSFFGMPKVTQSQTSPSDNLDDFVTQSQVTQSRMAQPQATQSQVAQPQQTPSQADTPTPSSDTVTNESPATPHRGAPAQVTESRVTQPQVTEPQVAQPQGTTPAASCGIVAEEPQKTFATYRVYIERAFLAEAEELLADCPQDANGYRVENGAAPMLESLSALPGYRTECIENDVAQTDYILLIGE